MWMLGSQKFIKSGIFSGVEVDGTYVGEDLISPRMLYQSDAKVVPENYGTGLSYPLLLCKKSLKSIVEH